MNFDLPKKQYSITIAEEYIGDVMGKLVAIGGLMKDSGNNIDGVITFGAEIPISETLRFTEWVSKITEGEGKVVQNT